MTFLYSLGLMSGTSIDAIDGTIVRTNGIELENLGIKHSIRYPNELKILIKSAMQKQNLFMKDKNIFHYLTKEITLIHRKLVEKLITKSNVTPDIIGFHGQTIYHNPTKGISLQLGDAFLLSKLLRLTVISDFRNNDLKHGGQGAPIAPIYHKSIMEKYKFNLPCCFLNIGGVANISFWDGNNLTGFDTGPGNGLIDYYVQKYFNLNFDRNGHIASKGKANMDVVNYILKNKFFTKKGPKSLDKFSFSYILKKPSFISLKPVDAISTLTELTIKAICNAINLLPCIPLSLIIMGGGQKNLYLINEIKKRLNFSVNVADDIGLDGQIIEAELIAFLAARRVKNLPITFPNTTGVSKPIIGGNIFTNYF